jgi:Fur family ferric uptake transcriptional regulator
MNEQHCTLLLEQHSIKPTVNRILVAKALASAGRPMSLSELEHALQSVDKSGISRALSLFRANRLVHVIEGGSDGVRYELCLSHHEHVDDDMHVHFYCEQCHKTFCIDNTPVPIVGLPDGYRMLSANYIIKGICPDCAKP